MRQSTGSDDLPYDSMQKVHVMNSKYAQSVILTLIMTMTHCVPAVERPNIVVIFTDDHGYTDLSCQGIADDIRTPHIDQLAQSGVRMTSGYVTAPQCVPSRAGLLSGRYQNRFGVESNGMPLDGFDSQQTIAEMLKTAGYTTGMTGKWHLGPSSKITDHGFDDVFYMGGSWINFDLNGNDVPRGSRSEGMYHIDAGSAAAKAFIRRHHNQPFFLYVAYRAPHVPLDPTPKYLARFPGKMPERRRKALAMLSAVDDGVGGIVDSLREYGIEDQTLIFLIGDNGAPLKIHKLDQPGGGPGWDGSINDPLNGEKGMLTEGGIRVPFVVSWPGTIPAGQVYEHPVISLDVAATAAALAGVESNNELDGVNLVPFLTGESAGEPHARLYWRWIAQSAVRQGKWKYLRGGRREYLFDVVEDPEEQHDLLATHPMVAAELRSQLQQWSLGLQPAGLSTKEMSETWESYFDHYLDGKAVPVPTGRANSGSATSNKAFNGWLLRQGTATSSDKGLMVRPERGNRSRQPFLACNGLRIPGTSTVTVNLANDVTGDVFIEWRESGQRDFPAGQKVKLITEDGNLRTLTRRLAAKERVIHLRLILPASGADVQDIKVSDTDGNEMKRWTFSE